MYHSGSSESLQILISKTALKSIQDFNMYFTTLICISPAVHVQIFLEVFSLYYFPDIIIHVNSTIKIIICYSTQHHLKTEWLLQAHMRQLHMFCVLYLLCIISYKIFVFRHHKALSMHRSFVLVSSHDKPQLIRQVIYFNDDCIPFLFQLCVNLFA